MAIQAAMRDIVREVRTLRDAIRWRKTLIAKQVLASRATRALRRIRARTRLARRIACAAAAIADIARIHDQVKSVLAPLAQILRRAELAIQTAIRATQRHDIHELICITRRHTRFYSPAKPAHNQNNNRLKTIRSYLSSANPKKTTKQIIVLVPLMFK